ncbi:alpha/beta hydrolase [Calidifontimicrobium sp. SYSU G02091]|uniref:alpha/beta hydrolase n=1 Tax=Calidifontimicrobium sp. SYSU G02091 TaxID=2926421 RepID=UPI001F53E1C4|nr:alpha/beta hydrolase [Calidifontimicrobium sp. SYSU G02091]MCI1192855.1 alpha/beta hydrolase [Calidifontimicrobium sp. SYSU G02091]
MPPSRPDPAWLDAQYNNRARIPEHPQIFARWQRDSLAARQSLRCALDERYGDGAGETLDVFEPKRAGAPVLVFIHGGYWRALDKADQSFVAPAYVDAGAMVVVPNYALAPAVTVAHITLQMVRALAWVWREAPHFGGDPRRLVVAGHSAGGHLAAMLMLTRWRDVAPDLPADLVTRAVAISGLFDLEPLRHAPFIAADLQLSAADVRRLSPARLPAPAAGELVALVGGDESEEFRRQNRLIRRRWGERAVPVCEEVPGRHHLDVLDAWADPHQRAHGLTLERLGLA